VTRAAFQRVGAFETNDMPRAAERLERNLQKKFLADDLAPAAQLYANAQVVNFTNCVAKFGDLVKVDPSVAALTVLLPRPDDPKADCIRVANIGTSTRTITLLPIYTDTFVNSTTSFTMTTGKQAVELYPDRFAKNWIVVSDGQAVPADVIITPASVSSTQNSWAPADATDATKTWSLARIIRVTLGATIDVGGLDPAVGVTEKTFELISAGTIAAPFYIRFLRQSSAGISGGKIINPYPNDAYLIKDGAITLRLDTTSGGWRVL
jgi:hypothetical protein